MKHGSSNTRVLTARPLHTCSLAFAWLSLLLLFSEVPSSRKSSLIPLQDTPMGSPTPALHTLGHP